MRLDIQRFAKSVSTTFSESNVSIPNNTSSLTINIYFSPNNTSTWFQSATLYCTCNGVQQSKKVSLSKGGHVDTSFTFNNIKHNNDGTKSVSWSWSCSTGTSVLGDLSYSGTRTLQKIPRASGLSFNPNPAELGEAITISLTKYIEGTTDTLTWKIGDATGTIGTTDEDMYIWTPSIYLAELITNSTSTTCVISCTSYDDDTLIGTSTANLTLEVPSSIVPSVSIGTLLEADEAMIAKNWNVFVQNKSKLQIPITANGIYGSDIVSIVTTINNNVFNGSNIITPTLITSGQSTISTIVTDTRGRTATTTKTYNVEPYANPTITSVEAQRCLQDGTIDEDGTYILYTFVGSISSAANNNSKLFQIGYKKKTDENYTFVTISNTYSVNETNEVSSFTISPDYAYDIIFQAVDSFMTTAIGRELIVGFDLMNFNASGKAMAIGKVSEAGPNEELLEIDLPVEVLQPMSGTDASFETIEFNSNDLEDTLFYKSGDVIELGSTDSLTAFVIDGYISNSSKDLYMSIPVPKRLDKITTITAVSINVEARGHDGYLNATGGYVEYVGASGYTFYIDKSSENTIKFRIQKSTAWTKSGGTATNNVPISLAGYFKFTLT